MAYTPLMRGDLRLEPGLARCMALMSLARRRRSGSTADEAEQDDRTMVAFVVEDAAA